MQNFLYVIAIVYLGLSLLLGWRRGFIRSLMGLIGLIAGFFVGMGLGGIMMKWLSAISPLFGVLVGTLIGLSIGLAIYIAFRLLGAILFKKTVQQQSRIIQLLYGLGGALIGGFIAMLVIGSVAGLIDLMGTAATSNPSLRKQAGISGVFWKGVSRLNLSTEKDVSNPTAKKSDVLPESLQNLLTAVIRLSSDPSSAERLMEYPGIQSLMEDPKMVELSSDPEIVQLIEQKNFMLLLTHQKIWAALNDPVLAAKLQKINLQEALEFASGPSPASSPVDPELPQH